MSICRGCGREIDWIRTVAGKNMPVDPAPVFVIGANEQFRNNPEWWLSLPAAEVEQ